MSAENSKRNSVVGTPFEKGKSGNPGGRPKRDPVEVAKWVEAAKGNLEVLIKIRTGSEKDSDRLRAIEIIEDRAYGKPLQQIDASVETTIVNELDSDQRKERLAEIEAELARIRR